MNKVCPKCSNVMKKGNFSGLAVQWDAEEEQTFLKKPGQQIVTYACEGCGYLESYIKK